MSLFRSQPMTYTQINVSKSAAHDTVRALGSYGKLHIVDLADPKVQSKEVLSYKRKVVECLDWEKRLDYFRQLMDEYKVEIPSVFPLERNTSDVIDGIKHYLPPLEEELQRHIVFKADREAEKYALHERSLVLQVCRQELRSRDFRSLLEEEKEEIELLQPTRFHSYICGIIPQLQQSPFERMLYRATRGNALVHFIPQDQPVHDPQTGEAVLKSVFYVVSIGERMHEKISRMTTFFQANIYEVPESTEAIDDELAGIRASIKEHAEVLLKTKDEIVNILAGVAHRAQDGTSPLRDWMIALKKERAASVAMTKAHHYITYITIEGWVPTDETKVLDQVLHEAVAESGEPAGALLINPDHPLATPESPPTHFKGTKLTEPFQGLVDTYGVPRYQEVNPGLFTIITFPFLFGMMYGDIGHGTALTLGAAYMVMYERYYKGEQRAKRLPEMLGMVFEGRYMLLLMGMFAVYAGFIYNDCVSIPIDLFGTRWTKDGQKDGSVYPFGVDPGWYHTQNELLFFNSLKMKLSVTVGVVHMTFGLLLSALNHVYFGDRISLIFEFIPQILFMMCTFGYMIFLIVLKYSIDWSQEKTRHAPNLIQTMIGMFLEPGHVPADQQLYPGQAGIQLLFVLVALLCIPTMLLAKPLVRRAQYRKKHVRKVGRQKYNRLVDDYDSDDENTPLTPTNLDEQKMFADDSLLSESVQETKLDIDDQGVGHNRKTAGPEAEEHDFSEELIHQAIHTIEFVLGTVSNTASYLRLWALSLAHAELSDVFWKKMIMEYGIKSGNAVMMVMSFAVWVGATVFVLLSMDVLECFLHALRLHWVEFQNKFYHADGYSFHPFTFDEVLAEDTLTISHL